MPARTDEERAAWQRDLQASWDEFTAGADSPPEVTESDLRAREPESGPEAHPEPLDTLRAEPQGVKELTWRAALTRATASGTLDPVVMAYGLVFAQGGWDYSTGRQTQGKALGYLAAQGMGSVKSWQRHLGTLEAQGWLTRYSEVRQGPRPTPLYLLTTPVGQD